MAKIGTLVDNFGSTSGLWSVPGDWAVNGGQMVGTLKGTAISMASNGSWDLTDSSFSAQCGPFPPNGGQFVLCPTQYSNSPNSVSFLLYWTGSKTVVEARQTVSGSATAPGTFDYDPVLHRYMRIREASGTTYWETSPEGLKWTVQRSAATPITVTAVYVLFQAGSGSGSFPVDNVNVFPNASSQFFA